MQLKPGGSKDVRSGRGGVISAEKQRPISPMRVRTYAPDLRVGPSQSEALRVGMGGLACVSALSQPSSIRWYAYCGVGPTFKLRLLSQDRP